MIKNFDFLHLLKRVYFKTIFYRYYRNFFENHSH